MIHLRDETPQGPSFQFTTQRCHDRPGAAGVRAGALARGQGLESRSFTRARSALARSIISPVKLPVARVTTVIQSFPPAHHPSTSGVTGSRRQRRPNASPTAVAAAMTISDSPNTQGGEHAHRRGDVDEEN